MTNLHPVLSAHPSTEIAGFWMVGRQTAPYSPELEPDIVLTQPHASGVDETCTPLVIAEGGSIPLHWMAELIAFSTWLSYGGNRAECSVGCQRRGIVMQPEPFDAPSAPLFPRKGMEEHRKRATRSISPIHTPTPGEQK